MKIRHLRIFRIGVSVIVIVSIAALGYTALRAKRVMLDRIDGLSAVVSELEQGCPL